jgi:hypothetical protein
LYSLTERKASRHNPVSPDPHVITFLTGLELKHKWRLCTQYKQIVGRGLTETSVRTKLLWSGEKNEIKYGSGTCLLFIYLYFLPDLFLKLPALLLIPFRWHLSPAWRPLQACLPSVSTPALVLSFIFIFFPWDVLP